jgi:hypothetical protein
MATVTVDPLALTPSQPLRGDFLGSLRNGSVIQARVVAMLEANIARLAILGQTIDVSTPIALKAGTTLPVGVDNTGGGLKLLIQAEGQAQAPRSVTPPVFSNAIATTISAALVAITDAMLSAGAKTTTPTQAPEGGAGEPAPPSDTPGARSAPATPPAEAQAPAQTQMRSGLSKTPSTLTAAEAQQLAASQSSSPFMREAQATAAYSQAAFAAPAQNSAQAVTIPLVVPQFAAPIEVRVEPPDEEEQEGSDGTGQGAGRSWRVSLSMDAGALGLVHIGVGFRAGAISVTFTAGETQAAAHLRAWLPELKTALEDADLTVEELSAQQRIALYDDPSQSLSITL